MIEIQNVSLTLDDNPILHEVTLTLAEKRIAIVGSNGSGKSSFARLLNGLRTPSEGRVLVDGYDTQTEGRKVRRRVGFVFQNPDNQIVFPIVEEDVAFGLKNLGVPVAEREKMVDEVLNRYGLLSKRKQPSHTLSGGQKQLLAIAGVLVMKPAYVVLDEPTTLLDLRNKLRVSQAIDGLDQTAIMVTHDLDLVENFDRVIVFDQGRIIADDVPNKALRRYVEAMLDA
ncbi:energy-coupling factor ABC transporter ATP-binding protein [Tritonibacter mobilis]|uniref:energy-coupling factor ABC transporter ATP-binding protein n=1 Tax=Tritonibacter mobilis TaxID=379347 RepID=UPI001C094C4B|nr:ATP-binding cassette domain-containing protein [Tritonibacter mobilis]MBU3036582.1 ATP-binding cassette domain-containing protein [Tritonibacter mobilis]WHQ84430.1 ATP-binding cassette domain-containing protein [Tritonibacter mobilis]